MTAVWAGRNASASCLWSAPASIVLVPARAHIESVSRDASDFGRAGATEPLPAVSLTQAVVGLVAALVIAAVTAPVGISGAVFLLPVQLSVLHVPSPAVTPTNLLFNVVAAPGALLRYRRQQQLMGPLTRRLTFGTLPGVIVGSVIHVYVAAGPRSFRILAAAVLIPIGVWLLLRTYRPRTPAVRETTDGAEPGMRPRTITGLALAVGVAGGIYGIGGGSILGPILVGSGMSIATVAPAALASTFVTSAVGAVAYALLALTTTGDVGPNWPLGLTCGVGGLIGGYLGARIQHRLPETGLKTLLGTLAVALGLTYVLQATL